MTDQPPPVRPHGATDFLQSLLHSPPRGDAVKLGDMVSPVSITINIAAGAVLNVSIGAGRDDKKE